VQNTVPAADVMIPKARFDEINNQLKELRLAQEKAAAEKAAAEKAELEKRQEYQVLYETTNAQATAANAELATMKVEQEKATAVLAALWEAKKSIVPEVYRELVEALPLTGRLEWLAKNESKLTPTAKGGTPSPQGSNGNLAKQVFALPPLKF
jgi:folylpolyglutamate synthase/dihydropteroate synthase